MYEQQISYIYIYLHTMNYEYDTNGEILNIPGFTANYIECPSIY